MEILDSVEVKATNIHSFNGTRAAINMGGSSPNLKLTNSHLHYHARGVSAFSGSLYVSASEFNNNNRGLDGRATNVFVMGVSFYSNWAGDAAMRILENGRQIMVGCFCEMGTSFVYDTGATNLDRTTTNMN
eukprot:TRINITY_DN31295_c0_g1_i1.p1 TRINITY_DN31295_c0_g1~~TRINITY_DN31295_c0_g1_i1.p1  ORF type:complete len:131 (-),score=9.78 TRINITY_DN31295_c0_g1_i1:2-394(-)